MKKILITGGSGLLGVNLAVRLRHRYEVVILTNKKKIDISSTISVYGKSFLSEKKTFFKPDLVINTVALTNIELCEKNPLLALETNLDYLKPLVLLCKKNNSKLIHISTDHLSDGLTPFAEEYNDLNPINQYAKTKLQAEDYIERQMPDAVIIRTNFFGWGPSYRRSFSDRIINTIKHNREIFLFEDAFFSPVSTRRLSKIIAKLFEYDAQGIFNVSSNDRISKLQFGLKICDYFQLDKMLVIASSFEHQKQLTNRPKDTSLNNEKVSSFLNFDCGSVLNNINDLSYDVKDGIKDEIMKL